MNQVLSQRSSITNFHAVHKGGRVCGERVNDLFSAKGTCPPDYLCRAVSSPSPRALNKCWGK